MSDNSVRTKIVSGNSILDFQEYFVKRGIIDIASDVFYEGAHKADLAPGISELITEAECIIFCPNNPILSIASIISVSNLKDSIHLAKLIIEI